MVRRAVAELVGTFFLVLTVCITGNPLAVGAMLMAMVYVVGHVSGAHLNPAVSLAVWLRGKLALKQMLASMAAQVVGAVLAAEAYYLLTANSFIVAPHEGFALWQVGLVETLFTFAFCLVVLTVATSAKFRGNFAYGAAIGFTLMACIFAGSAFSGGVYNPAIPVASTLLNAFLMGVAPAADVLNHLALYVVAPLLGGALAAYAFCYLNPDESY